MEKMKFICYPKCTTCQKAKKWLDECGIQYEIRNIKEENPSYDELKTWLMASGLPVRKFFNTSGLLYKSLNLRDKLPTTNEEECLKLLGTDGMLVKRPLLIGDDGVVLVGFRETEWEKAIKNRRSLSL
jgi:arsenate reductase